MYTNPKARIILNEHETDFFERPIGVKQGDSISATLFAIFINNLAEEIKQSEVCLELNCDADENLVINVLMYCIVNIKWTWHAIFAKLSPNPA